MDRFTSRDTRGFTRIELPVFLDPREKAWDSAANGGTHDIGLGGGGGKGFAFAGHVSDGDVVVS